MGNDQSQNAVEINSEQELVVSNLRVRETSSFLDTDLAQNRGSGMDPQEAT